jgi:hypothetical protein
MYPGDVGDNPLCGGNGSERCCRKPWLGDSRREGSRGGTFPWFKHMPTNLRSTPIWRDTSSGHFYARTYGSLTASLRVQWRDGERSRASFCGHEKWLSRASVLQVGSLHVEEHKSLTSEYDSDLDEANAFSHSASPSLMHASDTPGLECCLLSVGSVRLPQKTTHILVTCLRQESDDGLSIKAT